jgi:hexulose-6-phosphate isomerase
MNNILNRRDFVKTGTLAVGALLAAGGVLRAAEAAPAKRAFKKAIMLDTAGIKGTVLERFKAIKEAGFDGVEPSGGMNQDEVAKAFQETGLLAASVCCHTHWAKPVSDPSPEVRAAGLAGLQQSLRDAKRYGATSVLFVPGTVKKEVTYEVCWKRSIEEIRKAIPLAAELQVRIAIENVWNEFITKEEQAVAYVDEFNSPWVGWHFDTGNIIHYGDPINWIKALGKRISRVHLKEYSLDAAMKSGKWAGFKSPFLEGANNWPGIMKALDEVGYTGWCISELGGAKDPASLREMSDRISKIIAS